LRGHTIDTFTKRSRAVAEMEGRDGWSALITSNFTGTLALAMLLLWRKMFCGTRFPAQRDEVKTPTFNIQHPTSNLPSLQRSLRFCCCQSQPTLRRRARCGNQIGYYTNALQEFERLAQVNTNDLRLKFCFNAGPRRMRDQI